ncbi:unnamed protein product [Prorocentrum cordatum]|uniref:Uncharacterized protein n=1 Tax=Prorocentrum cordatum TaxID=2364126 RepID=A0ABN9UFF4_9DINO|nr:unnamed protein product [Polarella glacialis]
MYTENTPFGIIRKVSKQDGFDAYRWASYQRGPQKIGDVLSKLMQVQFDESTVEDFLDYLASSGQRDSERQRQECRTDCQGARGAEEPRLAVVSHGGDPVAEGQEV